MSTISSLSSQSATFTFEDLKKIAEEQNQKKEENQQTFSMKTQASIQAEKEASQPRDLWAQVDSQSNWNKPGMGNAKQLKDGIESHASVFAEMKAANEEHVDESATENSVENTASKTSSSDSEGGESAADGIKTTSSGEIKVAESTSTPKPKKLAKPKVESIDIVV